MSLRISFSQDTNQYTIFIPGKSLVALNGYIGSSLNDRYTSLNTNNQALNSYAWNIKLAKVVARNYSLGFVLDIEKVTINNLLVVDNEVLSVGPWMSYYFTKGQPGGLFLQGALLYINYYEKFEFNSSSQVIDEISHGKGTGGLVGLGYTYVVFGRIGLELSMNYRRSWIWSEIDDVFIQTQTHSNFTRVDINFKFGFIILFNKLKEDE